jgi:PPM family protein phosphatase
VTSMESVFKTDIGKVRQHNEDSGGIFISKRGDRLAIVADGMGGHNAGDVASEMTVNLFKESWENTEEMKSPEQAESWLRDKISDINQSVYLHAKNHKECEGMGTTVVAAICTDTFTTIANIGDSRCYILNESGFKQLTDDHTLVNELVKTGQITKEDAEHHPRKNLILKALGTEESIRADFLTIIHDEGDYLLLCSDGLSNKVSEQSMQKVLLNEMSLSDKAGTLIEMANQNGGEDNITLIVIQFAPNNESGCNEC